jgi:hypothetical protein
VSWRAAGDAWTVCSPPAPPPPSHTLAQPSPFARPSLPPPHHECVAQSKKILVALTNVSQMGDHADKKVWRCPRSLLRQRPRFAGPVAPPPPPPPPSHRTPCRGLIHLHYAAHFGGSMGPSSSSPSGHSHGGGVCVGAPSCPRGKAALFSLHANFLPHIGPTTHTLPFRHPSQTGWYLPELAHPYYELLKSGRELVFASPLGGVAPLDPGSADAFKADPGDPSPTYSPT